MPKITREQAENELTAWLNYKKVFQSARDTYKDNIEILVESLQEGHIAIDAEKFTIRHILLNPPEDGKLTELTYKARVNDRMIQGHMKGVATTDGDARLLAIGAALTDSTKGILSALDSSTDKKILFAIVVFFI